MIHVALVDLLLGEESGLEVVRRIKARYPEAEVVVVSDSNSVEAAIRSYALNVVRLRAEAVRRRSVVRDR